MLFQPTYIKPSAQWGIGNGTVDATEDLVIKWQVNGNSAMTAYKITIYDNDAVSTQKYTTGKITTNCPFYPVKYNGETELFSHTIIESILSDSNITNGNEYKFVIEQWWSADDSVVQSSASVFYTRANPTVTMASIPSPVTTRAYSFTATYAQAQGDALNWARWEIADAEGDMLYDSQNLFGVSQLQCDFDGFFTGNSYKVRCTIQTEKGIEASTGWIDFTVNYQTSEWESAIDATCIKGKSCVELSWGSATYIPATITGTAAIDTDHLNITAGSHLIWDEVNGEPMEFGTPWSFAIAGKAGALPVEAPNGYWHDLASITMKNGKRIHIEYRYGELISVNLNHEYIWLFNYPTDVIMENYVFVLTPSTAYISFTGKRFGLTPSEYTTISNTLYPNDFYPVSVRNFQIQTKPSAYVQSPVTEIWVANYSTCTTDAEVSYVWLREGSFTEEEISAMLSAPLDSYTYKPSATPNTYMLAQLTPETGTGAGTISTGGALSGFDLYRRNSGESKLKLIASISANAKSVRDYGIASQQGGYIYYLFPKSASSYSSPPLISAEVNPMFWMWTLLACEENERGEYIVRDEYNFTSNISTSAVSNNNEPNVLKNFTRYPSVQLAPHNFQSGTLTSLVGGIHYDETSGMVRYTDSLELRNSICELSTNKGTIFLKNRKGDVLEVRISDAIEMATNDNSREQILTMTLPWVEVADAREKTIIAQ